MALTSKYDPPVPATEYCPKPLMVYMLSVDYRDIEKGARTPPSGTGSFPC
jgi:hypothetical protein